MDHESQYDDINGDEHKGKQGIKSGQFFYILPKQFLRNFLPIDPDVGAVAGLADLAYGCGDDINDHVVFTHDSGLDPFNDACLVNVSD